MKLTILNKALIALGGILAIFIITNPSASAFKEYLGRNNYKGLKRQSNYFIFSEYQDSSYTDHVRHEEKYYGVLGNFMVYHEPFENIGRQGIPQDTTMYGSPKMTISQFAQKIKSRYPEYRAIDNKILVEKILNKYPVYKETVNLSSN
ncbi:hypothetical protein [Mucilaginibacter sp. dw_454]|uniref:hypothetical protein n=1 Tax=Mucilaginibacter sp. dw_454 TaxID=2720079 RepID=UPI001BD3B41A|nr:hypothetical protein [Mucilaginibacter sp. dw_454]